ncbi:MAG TPA: ADP-glyceromanno-heptose 6-epimerase [Bacteroidales bacterium]|nr:ADP-glyceromanno-heptose 6-epimerase [Bacteroidales bacterium]
MIAVTGAAGFIGSVVAGYVKEAYPDLPLVIVDDFSRSDKVNNYQHKNHSLLLQRENFADWLSEHADKVQWVIHLGARTDTTEFDKTIFDQLNVRYTQQIWRICAENGIPLIYASSAATYGEGELGYKDDHDLPFRLKPLNPYGESKNEVDKWALSQAKTPPFWAGLKFFNVYGPNEYHKGRMASVVFHAFRQIKENGSMKLFRSHRPDFEDGKQLRDFIYVKDLAKVILFMMAQQPASGLYNLGTGKARTFLDLANATFDAMERPSRIFFVDTPEDIRDKYQYFTEADMTKLRHAGYTAPFSSLEDGITDYVRNYLLEGRFF